MALTAAERAKNYRDRLKQKTKKYIDFKRKDCERKARKRTSMNINEKEVFLNNHRITQRRHRQKLKAKDENTVQPNSSYSKYTLAKAVKKVLRVLPNDQNKQRQVVKRVGQDLGLFQKPKSQHTQANLSESVIKKRKWNSCQISKTILLFNIREVHELFIQEHPGISISRSSFAKIRPKYILPKYTLAHRICVCVVHENVSLLLEVLSKEVRGLKDNLNEFLCKMVCDESEESCMMSSCDTCGNNFKQQIINKIIDKKKVVKWFQWENINGRAVKQVFSDYAENFTIDNQNQIQSAHWNKKYISIFTAYAWMGGSGGEGQSFGLVSNSTKHDKYSVITCLQIIVNEIINMMPDLELLRLVPRQGDRGRVGGTLKRLVWLEIMAGKRCASAEDFVKICHQKTKTISVVFVKQAQLDVTKSMLEKTFMEVTSIPGLQKQHHIEVLHKDVIQFACYATSEQQYVFRF
ncbi:unnamed protein product [Rotaria socialis]|uniref:Uncharacterized protein n=1 Tax=Rotaria socialis TaxID=392032 RepID=A0A820TT93_9BILA|nr:unnamed protein product [Rotaria socialis]CAF4474502.1 unnamed protein product [Rotaria socialis]CAF4614027.1 unnamed protein product [Rotaria socialis]